MTATYCKPENELTLTQPQQSLQMLGQVLLFPQLHHDHSQCTQQSAGYEISILTKEPALLTDWTIACRDKYAHYKCHAYAYMDLLFYVHMCVYNGIRSLKDMVSQLQGTCITKMKLGQETSHFK